MKEYPRIGDMVVIPESYKETQEYRDHYHSDRDRLDALLGRPVEVFEVSKSVWNPGSIGFCGITDGKCMFVIPLEYAEDAEHAEGKTMREISTKPIKIGEHVLIDGVEYVAKDMRSVKGLPCRRCDLDSKHNCNGGIPCDGVYLKEVKKATKKQEKAE